METPQSRSESSLVFAKDVRSYVLDYIKVCDAKAGAVSTGIALVGAVVGSIAERTVRLAGHRSDVSMVIVLLALGTVVLAVVMSVLRTINTLFPRTPTAAGSLASFPDIAKQEQAKYVEQVCALEDQAITAEYAAHTWTLSHVALGKFTYLKKALTWLTIAALGTVFFVGLRIWMERGPHEQETTNIRILPSGQ